MTLLIYICDFLLGLVFGYVLYISKSLETIQKWGIHVVFHSLHVLDKLSYLTYWHTVYIKTYA